MISEKYYGISFHFIVLSHIKRHNPSDNDPLNCSALIKSILCEIEDINKNERYNLKHRTYNSLKHLEQAGKIKTITSIEKKMQVKKIIQCSE